MNVSVALAPALAGTCHRSVEPVSCDQARCNLDNVQVGEGIITMGCGPFVIFRHCWNHSGLHRGRERNGFIAPRVKLVLHYSVSLISMASQLKDGKRRDGTVFEPSNSGGRAAVGRNRYHRQNLAVGLHVQAPAPKIIMRRLSSSETTVTPAVGNTNITDVSFGDHQPLFATALAALRKPRQVRPAADDAPDPCGGEKLFVDYAGERRAGGDRPADRRDPGGADLRRRARRLELHYAEATWTQGLADWIGAHTRAFAAIGGVPPVLVPDNTKTAVIKA